MPQDVRASLLSVPSPIGALIFHFLDIADVGLLSATSHWLHQFASLSLDLPRSVRCLHRITTSSEPILNNVVSSCRISRVLSRCSRVLQVCEALDEFERALAEAQVRVPTKHVFFAWRSVLHEHGRPLLIQVVYLRIYLIFSSPLYKFLSIAEISVVPLSYDPLPLKH